MMRNFILYLTSLLITIMIIFGSCKKDDEATPVVYGLNTENLDGTNFGKGFPNSRVLLQGEGLANIQSIEFLAHKEGANLIPTIFNPSLNSDKGLFFNVPFDFKEGSRFGMQTVIFTKKDGQSFAYDFEILQPKPEITEVKPLLVNAGDKITIVGKWFFNVTKIVMFDTVVPFEVVSDTEITINAPRLNTNAKIQLFTESGYFESLKKVQYLDLEREIILSNFDDVTGVWTAGNNWTGWGAFETPLPIENSLPNSDGNYMVISWKDDGKTNGGFQLPNWENVSLGVTQINPAKAKIQLDIHPVGNVDKKFNLYLKQGDDVFIVKDLTFDEGDQWQTKTISMNDFKGGWDGDDLLSKVTPSMVTRMGITMDGLMGAGKIAFDNVIILTK